jgi:nitric oxide reductase subunit C
VPGYAIINKRVDYQFNDAQNRFVPVIGQDEPLFGKMLSEEEAMALVSKGKLTTQAKNCMECHTLLGNGAYYAPDLTKAWLDPMWGSKDTREATMVAFLMDPSDKLHNSIGRRMPKLGITEEEAKATVAFLKWMSAINTLGFPHNFKSMDQSDPAPAPAPVAVAPAEAVPAAAPAPDAATPVNSKEARHGSIRYVRYRQSERRSKTGDEIFRRVPGIVRRAGAVRHACRPAIPETGLPLRRHRLLGEPHPARQRPGGLAAVTASSAGSTGYSRTKPAIRWSA